MAEATEMQLRAEQLTQALWHDKEVGPKLQAMAKSMWSDVKTSEETFAPILAPIQRQNEDLAKKLEALQAEREAEREAARISKEERDRKDIEARMLAAREEYNLTDEGFDKMVARMKETSNYFDPEAAAAWVAQKNPPAVKGKTFGSDSLNLFGSKKKDDRFAALHEDPEAYMDDQFAEFVADPEKYTRETFAA